jgi:L-fuconolactonase
VGNLEPGTPDFRKHLERFHRNPLFRGIRCGNLWGRNLVEQVSEPHDRRKQLGVGIGRIHREAGLGQSRKVGSEFRAGDLVPSLRVVIDHLRQMEMPKALSTRSALQADLRELGKRPQIYAKVSEVLRRVDDRVPDDLNFYRATLDELWEIFGSDRLMYGSDWPNGDRWGEYPQVMKVVRVLHGQGFRCCQEVLLEEFSFGVPLDQTSRKPAQPTRVALELGLADLWAAPTFSD